MSLVGWLWFFFQFWCGGMWTAFLLFVFTLCTVTPEHWRLRYALRIWLQTCFVIPMFFLSSFLICAFQAMGRMSLFLPLGTRLAFSQFFSQFWWKLTVFSVEFWPGVEYFYRIEMGDGSPFDIDALKRDNLFVIINHAQSPFDWISGISFAAYLGRLHRQFAVMKREFLFYPTLGWIGYLQGNLALSRSWQADMPKLLQFSKNVVEEYPRPWMFGIYPEGTRQTPKKLEEAKEFARDRGFPVLQHLLQPRVKGFRFLVEHLRPGTRYVVDITTVYHPKPPSLGRFVKTGRLHKRTDFFIRVYPIEEVPTEEKEVDQWLRDRWTEKDEIIESTLNDKIEYRRLPHDPFQYCLCYGGFCVLFALWFWYEGLPSFIAMFGLITALFPIWIVVMEKDDTKAAERKLSIKEPFSPRDTKKESIGSEPIPARDGFDIESESDSDAKDIHDDTM